MKGNLILLIILIKGTVQMCGEGCLVCDKQGLCKFCDLKNNFYLLNHTCVKSTLEHCLYTGYYAFRQYCIFCQGGYFLDNITGACLIVPTELAISNCVQYDTYKNCVLCDKDFYLSSNKCLPVTSKINNCQYYTNDGICFQCQDGFMYNADFLECKANPSTIANCDAYTYLKCTKCKKDYYKLFRNYGSTLMPFEEIGFLSNIYALSGLPEGSFNWTSLQKCQNIKYLHNCATANEDLTCKTCNEGYYLDEGLCVDQLELVPYMVPYCAIYTKDGCTQCNGGYYYETSSTTCKVVNAITNCAKYEISTSASANCSKCIEGYYTNGGSCVIRTLGLSDISFCEQLKNDEDKCQTCIPGYIYNTTASKCFEKQDPQGIYSNLSDSIGLASCKSGYYLSDFNNVKQCIKGHINYCDQYNDMSTTTPQETCQSCKQGYYSEDNKCLEHRTIQNCQLYNTADKKDNCEQCENGFILASKETECAEAKAVHHCLEYSKTNFNCEKCDQGYFLDMRGQCRMIAPSLNCETMNNQEQCTWCKKGYQLIDGLCNSYFDFLTLNCDQISGNSLLAGQSFLKQSQCDSCKENYIPIDAKNLSVCAKTSQLKHYYGIYFVENCKLYQEQTTGELICLECKEGYVLELFYDSGAVVKKTACIKTCQNSQQKTFYVEGGFYQFRNFCQLESKIGTYLDSTHDVSKCQKYIEFRYSGIDNNYGCAQSEHYKFFNYYNFTFNYIQALPLRIKAEAESEDYYNYNVFPFYTKDLDNNEQPIENCEVYAYNANGTSISTDLLRYNVCTRCNINYFVELYKAQTGPDKYSTRCVESLEIRCVYKQKYKKVPVGVAAFANCLHVAPVSGRQRAFPLIKVQLTVSNDIQDATQDNLLLYRAGFLSQVTQTYINYYASENEIKTLNTGWSFQSENNTLIEGCAVYVYVFFKFTTDGEQQRIVCYLCNPGYKQIEQIDITDSEDMSMPGAPLNRIQQRNIYTGCSKIANCDFTKPQTIYQQCEQCETGYQLGIRLQDCQQKIAGDPNCLVYHNIQPQDRCLYCKKGYFVPNISNGKGKCEKLTLPYCYQTNINTVNSDKKDNSWWETFFLHYYFQLDNGTPGCGACHDGRIQIMSLNTLPVCVYSANQAADGDIYIPNCTQFTYISNLLSCYKCKSGYIAKSDGTCIQSSLTNCSTATDATTCSNCLNGYRPVNGACVKHYCLYYNSVDPFECILCENGYRRDSTNNKLCTLGQITDCLVYDLTDSNICIRCMPDQVPMSFKIGSTFKTICHPVSNSLNCDNFTPNQTSGTSFSKFTLNCTTCRIRKDKVYRPILLSNKSQSEMIIKQECLPLQNVENCQEYYFFEGTYSLKCKQCEKGYYIAQPVNKCIKVTNIPFCTQYHDNLDQCLACDSYYYLQADNLKCLPYPMGISNCAYYQSKGVCLYCKSQYYLKNDQCIFCSTEIANCLFYESCTKCKQCKDTFKLTAEAACEAGTVTNCLKYDSNGKCQKCNTGYHSVLAEGAITCKQDTSVDNCAAYTENTNTCSMCKTGYYLDTTCKLATAIEKCDIYDTKETCLICQGDYYLTLDKKKCLEIRVFSDLNCESWTAQTDSICLKCAKGYFLAQDGTCQSCTAKTPGCDYCDPLNVEKCYFCSSGYYMTHEQKCVQQTASQSQNDTTQTGSQMSQQWVDQATDGNDEKTLNVNVQPQQLGLQASNYLIGINVIFFLFFGF